MAKDAKDRSIFKGTDKRIHTFLGLGDGKTTDQKSTCRRLTSGPKGMPSFDTLLSNLYDLIEGNRRERMPSPTQPSQENWRINDKRETSISEKNRSPEILLERAIARLGKRGQLKDWFNQVPVASGLIDHKADKRAAIDLLRFTGDRAEFVELKWESNTPVFAAFEILLYGLVYLFARVNRGAFKYQKKRLMNVNKVSLRVLAPRAYYTDYHLEWLEQGLDEGVRAFAAKKIGGALTMGFNFLAFPRDFAPDFSPPYATGEEVRQKFGRPMDAEACRFLVSAMSKLEPAFRSGGREHS
ncbi:MAG: hypothetical protein IH904_06480 [Proteobacteria bacterium]|nr:hypothetical protein [Pseudomonadota bacterium]